MSLECCYIDSHVDDKTRVLWEITSACNERCIYCHSDSSTNIFFDVSQLEFIIEFFKINNITSIILSGGDPLIHPKLESIIKILDIENLSIVICTNGVLLTRLKPEILSRYNISKFVISLDSVREDDYNYLRGGNYFKSCMKGIGYLAEKYSKKIQLTTVISKINHQYLEEIIQFAIEKNIDCVLFENIFLAGKAVETKDTVYLDDNELLAVGEEINKFSEKYNGKIRIKSYRIPNNKEYDLHPCPGGINIFRIDCHNHVHACPIIDSQILDIDGSNIINIKKHLFKYFDDLRIKRSKVCHGCIHTDNCGKGCLVFEKKDPMCKIYN